MSAIIKLFNRLNRANQNEMESIFSEIKKSLNSNTMTKDEMSIVCMNLNEYLTSQVPLMQKSALIIINDIISEKELSSIIPVDFCQSLLSNIKTPLSSNNQSISNIAFQISSLLIPILGPIQFWNAMSKNFTDKSSFLKTNTLKLLLYTLKEFPNFKTKSFAKNVFNLLLDKSPSVRAAAYDVTFYLYNNHSESVEKCLKSQFSFQAEEIIKKIYEMKNAEDKSIITEKRPFKQNPNQQTMKNKSLFSSYAEVSKMQNETPKEICENLKKEFRNPLNGIEAIKGDCNFSSINMQLNKNVHWETRQKELRRIVGYSLNAKNQKNKEAFCKGLQWVRDGFESCINDARSALSKTACLSIAGLALSLGSNLDICSEWLLYIALAKTSSSGGYVPLYCELASMAYVQNVQGKNTKKVIEDCLNNKSEKVRMVAIKCGFSALDIWNNRLSQGLYESIIKKKNDPSDKVRNLLKEFEHTMTTFNSTNSLSFSTVNDSFSLETSIIAKAPLTNDDVDSIIDIMEVTQNHDDSLVGLIESKNVEAIASFIEKTKCDIFKFISQIMKLIYESFDNNTNLEDSAHLLSLIFQNYKHIMYPYLKELLHHLPNDPIYSQIIITIISKAFGEETTAKLMFIAKTIYACSFLMQYAEKNVNNIEFACKAIRFAIENGWFPQYCEQIINLLTQINTINPTKIEALVSSLTENNQKVFLSLIKTKLPSLYEMFNSHDKLTIQLASLLENSKILNQKSIYTKLSQIFNEIYSSNSSDCFLLALSILKNKKEQLNDEEVKFIINCATNSDNTISTSASMTLQKHAKYATLSIDSLLQNFTPCDATFKAIIPILNYMKSSGKYSSDKALSAIELLSSKINEGINSESTKYSALSTLNFVSSIFGIAYSSIYDKISYVNLKILNYMKSSQQ